MGHCNSCVKFEFNDYNHYTNYINNDLIIISLLYIEFKKTILSEVGCQTRIFYISYFILYVELFLSKKL